MIEPASNCAPNYHYVGQIYVLIGYQNNQERFCHVPSNRSWLSVAQTRHFEFGSGMNFSHWLTSMNKSESRTQFARHMIRITLGSFGANKYSYTHYSSTRVELIMMTLFNYKYWCLVDISRTNMFKHFLKRPIALSPFYAWEQMRKRRLDL
ncbi:hypothetical protein BDA99DRAFT_543182 [Phascolomyces articulosus]|uniref:Uncharacterized protein n=1 Tax=Phascolomyces articulosus TaxID=60185 RepID=A0AAD5JN19_9FUNG|nr:hypothetical protein BDA99DRAFT_543182 [Phascolomyces articulosus]